MINSGDLQWSGAHLTLDHIDPYHQELIHDPQHLILFNQVPNYLHELYVLLLPLGAMSFHSARSVWAVLNCIFTIGIILSLRRIYSLANAETLLLTLLLVSGTPYRVAVGTGQQPIFQLLLFCLIFVFTTEPGRGSALGLSLSKYSFSPPVFLYLLFQRRLRLVAFSLLPPLVGLLAMWCFVRGNLLTLALEPFMVSRNGVSLGLGDLMSLIRLTGALFLSMPVYQTIMAVAGLACSIAYAFWLSRQKNPDWPAVAAALATASLLFLTHLTYDYVLLAVPLASALRGPFDKARILVIALIGGLWHGLKIMPFSQRMDILILETTGIFLVVLAVLVVVSQPAFLKPDGALASQA
jgi:hypothetical protein